MSIDRISSKKLPDYFNREESPGFKFDTGPYVGVVKDNRDPSRSGRLQVWIAELGGDETDTKNWRTVSYASPFLGSTTHEAYSENTGQGSDKNTFKTVRHTYGMWFNVPDIGNFVLCTFVAGDATRGYYFASIPNQLGHHMVPAIASSSDVDAENIEDSQIRSLYQAGKIGPELPVTEFNEYNKKVNWPEFVKEKKPLHEPQVKILIEQGTDRPKLTRSRGSIFSTTQRETPMGVFGISTPGRSITAPPAMSAQINERKIKTRQGGHTFVMDDGDTSSLKGKNNLTRWRSSSGHQILMDDSDNILYISNSNGSTWIEMTGTGHINIYSTNSVNLRTATDLNLHVDRDFNLQVNGDFNVKVNNDINIESQNTTLRSDQESKIYGGTVSIGSQGRIDLEATSEGTFTAKAALKLTGEPVLINSGRGPKINKPRDIALKTHADTKKDGNGQWQIEPNKIKSVSKIVPTHEPWERKTGRDSNASNASAGPADNQSTDITQGNPPGTRSPSAGRTPLRDSSQQVVTDSSGNPILSGSTESAPGIIDADSKKVTRQAPASLMKDGNAPNFPNGLGNGLLSPDQAKALAVQIGYSESGNNYQAENSIGYIGKYQMGAQALVDMGYIKRSAWEELKTNKKVLNDENSWTGRDGIKSKEDFLYSPSVQEDTYRRYLEANLSTGLRTGYISRNDDPATIGGKLAAASLLGVGGAKKWLETGSGQDAFGTTGSTYYNRGRYAILYLSDSGKG